MKNLRNILMLCVLAIAFANCKNDTSSKRTAIETPEISFSKEGELIFYDTIGNVLNKVDIEVAKSSYEQQTGLMYRKKMKENQGMLFVYNNERVRPNFYMKNTYIPLDLIYIDANKKIVDFNENAKPHDRSLLPSSVKSQYVLEVNGGMVKKWDLHIGDSISFSLN